MMTDPIADMLTRIRNALQAGHTSVDIPASNSKCEIARILREEGYVHNVEEIEDAGQGRIRVALKYAAENEPVISGLERVSKPGRRVYCGKENVPAVLNGLGVAIISTSRGVLTDRQCRDNGVGGEVLCRVW